MINRKKSLALRKTHRYLGLFLGIQFLLWTISGLYFSWTNIDEIHGDHYLNPNPTVKTFDNLLSTENLQLKEGITSLSLKDIAGEPYYWINNQQLFHAKTGESKTKISEKEAIAIVQQKMHSSLEISGIEIINKVDNHHEYRGKPLPAYQISFVVPRHLKAYVSLKDGQFRKIRHRNWRWFDFLWMTHTMDYQGRDNFNNLLLRIFSLLGLFTVCSGFVLWGISSPTLRKILKKKKR